MGALLEISRSRKGSRVCECWRSLPVTEQNWCRYQHIEVEGEGEGYGYGKRKFGICFSFFGVRSSSRASPPFFPLLPMPCSRVAAC